MRNYIPGTIFVADVPFDDRGGTKRRPVVLVGKPGYWRRDNAALVCPVTTTQHRPDDVAIDWQAAGLARVSRVRPRPTLLPKADIAWRLGRLTDADLAILKRTLREILDL